MAELGFEPEASRSLALDIYAIMPSLNSSCKNMFHSFHLGSWWPRLSNNYVIMFLFGIFCHQMAGFLEGRDCVSLTSAPLWPLKPSILHRRGAKELFVEMSFRLPLYLNKAHLNKSISQNTGVFLFFVAILFLFCFQKVDFELEGHCSCLVT